MIGAKIAENEINAIMMQFPSGKFGFVGWRVPGPLMFTNSPDEIAKAKEAGCTQFLKVKAYPTAEEANTALADWLEANPGYVNVGGIAK
jgi:hypothetical protein